MSKFRKKPVVIEAIQWTGQNVDEVVAALGPIGSRNGSPVLAMGGPVRGGLRIDTSEGTMTANPGDWIIKGVKGELYPCKPDIFAATYEVAE